MDNTVPYTPTKGTATTATSEATDAAVGGRKTRRKKTRRKKTRRKKRRKTRRHKKRHRRHKTRRKKRTKRRRRRRRKKRKTRKYRGGASDADIEWVFNKINTSGGGSEIDYDNIMDAIDAYGPGISPRELETMVLSAAPPSTPRCFDPLTLNEFKQINNGFHHISNDNRITDSGQRVPGDNNWNRLFNTILATRGAVGGGGGGGAAAAAAAGGGGGQET